MVRNTIIVTCCALALGCLVMVSYIQSEYEVLQRDIQQCNEMNSHLIENQCINDEVNCGL